MEAKNRHAAIKRIAKKGHLIMSGIICLAGLVYMRWLNIPERFMMVSAGMILAAYGVVKIIGYLSQDVYCLVYQYDLAFGILLIVLSLFTWITWKRYSHTLGFACGTLIVLDGLLTIQMCREAKGFGIENWHFPLTAALITGVLGVVMMAYPFHSTLSQHVVSGLTLVAEGGMKQCAVRLMTEA